MGHNPELAGCNASLMARVKGFNKKNVMSSFDLLEKIVEKHKLNGTQIFDV